MNYAGFWKRFMAMVLDFLVLIIPGMLVSYVLPYVGGILLALFYFPIFEASPLQTTPGKHWMGLRVVQEDGQPVNFLRALGRFGLKYVSSMLMLVGYLIQPFTARRQTLHDLLVGCVVVESSQPLKVDWLSAWVKEMRILLRVDEAPASKTTMDAEFTKPQEPISAEAKSNEPLRSASLQDIEKLHELYKSGAITEDEYQAKKAQMLSQI